MAIFKVTVQATNRPDDKLVFSFFNRNVAWSFYAKTLGRDGIIDSTIDCGSVKSYGNVNDAITDLDFWSK